jgi:hypothetical protein
MPKKPKPKPPNPYIKSYTEYDFTKNEVNDENEVVAAYKRITGGKLLERVFMKDLRKELKGILTPTQTDAALVRLYKKRRIALMSADLPWERDPISAFVDGQYKRDIVYVDNGSRTRARTRR